MSDFRVGGTVSRDQLRFLGVDPECVVGGKRVEGVPLDVRYGDNRITRSHAGACAIYFGWFSESQMTSRKIMGRVFADSLMKSFEKSGFKTLMRQFEEAQS